MCRNKHLECLTLLAVWHLPFPNRGICLYFWGLLSRQDGGSFWGLLSRQNGCSNRVSTSHGCSSNKCFQIKRYSLSCTWYMQLFINVTDFKFGNFHRKLILGPRVHLPHQVTSTSEQNQPWKKWRTRPMKFVCTWRLHGLGYFLWRKYILIIFLNVWIMLLRHRCGISLAEDLIFVHSWGENRGFWAYDRLCSISIAQKVSSSSIFQFLLITTHVD